jgi:hypothetical protein
MSKSTKIILQVRFDNPMHEILRIQVGLDPSYTNTFELEGIYCYELNKRVNFFLLEIDQLHNLLNFLDYIGLDCWFKERDIKEFYDNVIFLHLNEEFKAAIEAEIISIYSVDDILDKVIERGANSLTPLDKYILNK